MTLSVTEIEPCFPTAPSRGFMFQLARLCSPGFGAPKPETMAGKVHSLKKAYIDAHYRQSYDIIRRELEYFGTRPKELGKLTKATYETKMESIISKNL